MHATRATYSMKPKPDTKTNRVILKGCVMWWMAITCERVPKGRTLSDKTKFSMIIILIVALCLGDSHAMW